MIRVVGRLAFLLVTAAAAPAAAKPLYITVPRTFSSTEQAQVSVSFAGKEPVELRVLAPANLDKYISEQANLRRAYVAPSTELNPGRYLSRGLNQLSNPGTFLYFAMSPAFRKAVAPALPERPEPGKQLSRLREGPERLVGIPPGMTLVRGDWLNLDLGGGDVDFNVPGFESWGGPSGYQERQVTLPKLAPGFYVLQIVQGTVEGQVTLVITDQTVQVKQTDGKVLVRVAMRDQRPARDVQVTVYQNGKAIPGGPTNAAGEVEVAVTEPRLLIVTRKQGDVAVVDTDFYSTLAVAPDVFIYSDRPIYRPGDEVQFRGVVRKPSSFLAELLLPKKRTVEVSLALQNGATLKTTASIDSYGSFSGALAVPESAAQGVVRLVARVDPTEKESAEHQAEARVQEYVKPTFYLELVSDQEGIAPGETLNAKVRARRYAGGVPQKTRYEYFLYRTQLDTPAWVDDTGRGGQGSAVTYGSVSTTEGKLSLPKRLFSSISERMENASAEADPWESAPTFDKNGEATLVIPVPALEAGEERLSFRYTLSVKARDDQDSEAVASKAFFLSDCDVVAQVAPSAKLVKQGGQGTFAIRAATLTGRAFGEAEGTLTLFLRDASGGESKLEEKAIKTGADGIVRVPLPSQKIGTVVARATLKDKKGRTNQGEGTVLVVGEGGEAVADVPVLVTEALSPVLEPGDTAELVALLPRGFGPEGKDKGFLWVTVSGGGIHWTKLIEQNGRTLVLKFNVEKRFGSAVYAAIAYPTASGRWDERAAAFRIIPRERVLTVQVEPGKAEVTPLGEQTLALRVTDSHGAGVAAQVSLGVVDKAIYALQAEIRPNIVDFFYPIARNNVSTFYSIDFQGYGYGEQLARLKRGLRPFEFAAVKTPTKRARDLDRDTAYWNPSVITGRDGSASVSFKMPSNPTLWVVTAVAADVSGRFGEGRAEFASRGNVSLAVAMPPFLRSGDEAKASVRVALGAGKAGKVALELAGSDAVSALKQDVTLAKGDEQVVPFSLKATSTGPVVAALKAVVGGETLSDTKQVAVRPAAIEETLRVSAWGGGELQLPVSPERLLSKAELRLVPSSVDAALSSAEDLLTYPFGCIEQLVSTTIPNVALYHLLQKQGLSRLDPSSQALMQLARSRAQNGIDRILALAQKGGGFTWFSGYSTPSVPLTMIALDGLSYAIDAGVVAREAPEVQESITWLAGQGDLPFAFEATRAYVLARLEGEKHAPRVRALVEKAEPTHDLYALAMATLAGKYAGIANEAGFKERIAAMVQRSRTLLAQNINYTNEAFFSYPLRSVGLSAIVAHAASGTLAEGDLKDARKRFVQALASPDLSTFDRGTLTLHHLWLIEKDAAQMKAMSPPAVDAGGAKLSLAPRGFGLTAELPAKATSVKVGTFEGVATLEAKSLTPLASVKPVSEGMSIQRNYYLLREQGRKKIAESDTLKVGDLVYVELEFDAEPGDKWRTLRSAYYVVEDAVPAGFVVQSEDKIYRSAPFGLPLAHEALKQRTFTPETATFFFEEPAFWSRSARTIGYVMRAQFAGRFQVPPATITDMYSVKVRARTKALSFLVEGK